MWAVVVQHIETNHVTRVLGLYENQTLAVDAAAELAGEHRGFDFSVHPVHAALPNGSIDVTHGEDE